MPERSSSDSQAAFPTTSWTMLCAAREATGDRRRVLLQHVLRSYWKPVYAFFRSGGQSPADAEDLVQGFLNRFVVGDSVLATAEPGRKFRTWVRVCARNYLIDQTRRANAARRSPERGVISMASLESESGQRFEPEDVEGDDVFSEVWRRELLDRALERLKQVCVQHDRVTDMEIFFAYYLHEGDQPTWADLARRFQLDDWQKAARKAQWVRRYFAEAIRDQVRTYARSESEIDDEIVALLG